MHATLFTTLCYCAVALVASIAVVRFLWNQWG